MNHSTAGTLTQLDVEEAVRQRYSAASQQAEAALCCPVEYEQRFLDALPRELVERDYGCGDPSRHVHAGETVLDLGSGGGKICYIASQIVGPEGNVLGVDVNDDMLALARRFQNEVGDRIGWHNVRFGKGRIQDLALDLERFEAYLSDQPVASAQDWLRAEQEAGRLRREEPMIESNSVDVVLSNCVLNLVQPGDRQQLFQELHRVLCRGGRAIISDIVSDEPVPERLRNDPALWSGCMSGAFLEHELLEQFARAGFYGIELLSRQSDPWATVEGIEFRSVTVAAYKGKEGPCLDHKQAVIYRGPWKSVTDDDGHVLRRGEWTAVCEKTFHIYSSPPYAEQVIPVPPHTPVAPEQAPVFDCRRNVARDPREIKGANFAVTSLPDDGGCCGAGGC